MKKKKIKGGIINLIVIRNGEWGEKIVKVIPEDSQKGIWLNVTNSTNSSLGFY